MTALAPTCVVAGATGAVGGALLPLLCDAYPQVVALTRRPLSVERPGLRTVEAAFDRLDTMLDAEALRGADVYCALGTTLRRAGSAAAFERVDREFVVALGRWARQAAARRLLVVSALGADARSRVLYNRVKGRMEADLRALGLRGLIVFRPSLLDADRAERRPAEQLSVHVLRPLKRLVPAAWRPVTPADVAAAMLLAARAEPGDAVIESAQMQGAAARLHAATGRPAAAGD